MLALVCIKERRMKTATIPLILGHTIQNAVPLPSVIMKSRASLNLDEGTNQCGDCQRW